MRKLLGDNRCRSLVFAELAKEKLARKAGKAFTKKGGKGQLKQNNRPAKDDNTIQGYIMVICLKNKRVQVRAR